MDPPGSSVAAALLGLPFGFQARQGGGTRNAYTKPSSAFSPTLPTITATSTSVSWRSNLATRKRLQLPLTFLSGARPPREILVQTAVSKLRSEASANLKAQTSGPSFQ